MSDVILQFNEIVQLLTDSPGGSNHLSDDAGDSSALGKRIVTPNCLYASVEFTWTGFNTADATITVQVSSTGLTGSYITKATATYTLATASGTNSFSLNGVCTEKYYRVSFNHGTNSAGTISAWIYGKTHGV